MKKTLDKYIIDERTVLLNAEKAIDYYEGNLKISPVRGFLLALEAARMGDPRNMVNVAWSYSEGHGVRIDFKKAIYWLKKAIGFKIPEAYYNLANHYEKGEGVSVNFLKAFKNYKISAELKYPAGMIATGWCYEYGIGVKKNNKKALFYYKKALPLNEPNAYLNAGLCYLYGKGVNVSLKKAQGMFEHSCLSKNSRAQKLLTKISRENNGINF